MEMHYCCLKIRANNIKTHFFCKNYDFELGIYNWLQI